MRIAEALRTLPSFIGYYLQTVDEHSLQAPFAYSFFTSLKKKLSKTQGLEDIELLRRELLLNNTPLQVADAGAGSHRNYTYKAKTISRIAKYEVSSWKKCSFLHALVQQSSCDTAIELGTSLGIATAYLSRACPNGKIITFEADALLCAKAKGHLAHLGCKNVEIIQGNIDQTLAGYLAESQPIGFAYIDANHTGSALERYFSLLKTKIAKNGMIVIDDIRWSRDMNRSWKKISRDTAVSISMEFRDLGILFLHAAHTGQHYVLENPM